MWLFVIWPWQDAVCQKVLWSSCEAASHMPLTCPGVCGETWCSQHRAGAGGPSVASLRDTPFHGLGSVLHAHSHRERPQLLVAREEHNGTYPSLQYVFLGGSFVSKTSRMHTSFLLTMLSSRYVYEAKNKNSFFFKNKNSWEASTRLRMRVVWKRSRTWIYVLFSALCGRSPFWLCVLFGCPYIPYFKLNYERATGNRQRWSNHVIKAIVAGNSLRQKWALGPCAKASGFPEFFLYITGSCSEGSLGFTQLGSR